MDILKFFLLELLDYILLKNKNRTKPDRRDEYLNSFFSEKISFYKADFISRLFYS